MIFVRSLFVALVFALLLSAPSMARVQLKDSFPKNGDHTMFHKNVVMMEFSEEITSATIEITDPLGRTIVDGDPEIEGDTVYQDIKSPQPPGMFPPGHYTVRWRVTGKSGEPGNDTFSFHVMQH